MSNALTIKAGLIFNVNNIKEKGLKQYFEQNDITPPLFKKAHVVVAGVLERIYEIIVSEAVKQVKLDTSGLKTITRPVLRNSILLNKELDQYFHMSLRDFNPIQMYNSQLPIVQKELDLLLETKIGKTVHLTSKAKNLLCYTLMIVFLDICRISSLMLQFSGKKTMDHKCVKASLKQMFRDTSVYAKLSDEINRIWNAVVDEKEDDQDDEEEKGSDNEHGENGSDADPDSETEGEKVVKKETKPKKEEQKKNKKINKKTEDVEESSDEESGSESGSESESEDEIVIAKKEKGGKDKSGKEKPKKATK